MSDARPHSLWLCPEAKAAPGLEACIASMAERTGAPAFAPHVTLLGDLTGPLSATREALAAHLTSGPVTASVTDVAQTDAYFMALFLDLRLSPDLHELRERLLRDLGVTATGFRPHLSLAYGRMPCVATATEVAEMRDRFRGATFRLDAIGIVASAREIAVEDWHVLHRMPLRGRCLGRSHAE